MWQEVRKAMALLEELVQLARETRDELRELRAERALERVARGEWLPSAGETCDELRGRDGSPAV